MDGAVNILQILTDIAPLALSTLILGSVLLFSIYAAVKVVIPAMHELVRMSEAQRDSWERIVKEQEKISRLMMQEVQSDLADERAERLKLDARVKEMDAEMTRKDVRITEMQREIDTLRRALADKDVLIRDLRSELDRVKADRVKVEKERDGLLHRIEALEKAQQSAKPDGDKPSQSPEPEVKHDPPSAASH